MKEGGVCSPSTLAPQILWQPRQNLIRARASLTLAKLCCSSSVQCELNFSSVLQCFSISSVVFQYCKHCRVAQCGQLCFAVFLCFIVFLCFRISIFLLSTVLHSGLTLPSALQLRSFLRRSQSIRGTRQDVAAIISRHAATKSKTGLTTSLLEYSWGWRERGVSQTNIRHCQYSATRSQSWKTSFK